jgi:5-methyltetrahydropteroyltriglutamate--homocysteine methyltransferase
VLFPRLKVQRLLLEYDDERAGSFEALRYVPEDKFIVLGLITSKTGQLERMDDLRLRIATASHYFPLAQLGVSTQCGFASSVYGNPISPEAQKNKLELVVRAAREFWR